MGIALLLFILVTVLAPIGSILFVGSLIGTFTSSYRDTAQALLKRGSMTGAICGGATVLFFLLQPDAMLPGGGTLAILLAVFMAGFAVSAGLQLRASR